MSQSVSSSMDHSGRLVAKVTCPNCWHGFSPEQILFVARHDSLIGDEIVGPTAYRRFLSTRFNLNGDAIDARGMACQQLACPRCHLEISRPLIEMLPVFTSVVGAPASGKSYFLASLTWEMRSRGPEFGFTFIDGDPMANFELQRYEEALFLNPKPTVPVALRKTEIQGAELYQTIVLEGQSQTFPRPFQFTINPSGSRNDARVRDFPYRALMLYDNAGEHFLPGQDSTNMPVTLHLAESAAVFFVFDPTQDPRFRRHCRRGDPQLEHGSRPGAAAPMIRQEVILNEMAARVRRYKGLPQTARHRRPLVVIVAKADIWLDHPLFECEPIVVDPLAKLDLAAINEMSDHCRGMMEQTSPELVAAATGFSEHVVFIPVSALGTSPELVEKDGTAFYGIQPRHIRPKWVTIPLLWGLSHTVPSLIATTQNGTRGVG